MKKFTGRKMFFWKNRLLMCRAFASSLLIIVQGPLTTQNKADEEGTALYFFISRKSEVAACVANDAHVNVAYAHPGDDRYVSVSGKASIVEDQARKDHLFTPFAKAWFPAGATDPDLALLQVDIGHAEYWDVKESKMM